MTDWWELNKPGQGVEFEGEGNFAPEFSNFVRSEIIVDNIYYPTVEHYFQAQKALDPHTRSWIASARNPGQAKVRGRQTPLREDWDEVKYEVMLAGLRAKFQRLDFKRILRDFPGPIVEWNTWHDRVWGVCVCRRCDKTGENLLGKALEQVREEIRGETDANY